jgi:hypothetical protein
MYRVGTSHDFILSTDAVNIGIEKSLAVAGLKEKRVILRKTNNASRTKNHGSSYRQD